MTVPVPPETVAAARAAAHIAGHGNLPPALTDEIADEVLAAVLPGIREDERNRCSDGLREAIRRLEHLAASAQELAVRTAVAAERWLQATPCPTPCDEDCELRPDGCHESHAVPSKRAHDPVRCGELRLAIARAVAAERGRLRKLAAERGAWYLVIDCQGACRLSGTAHAHAFADLIGDQPRDQTAAGHVLLSEATDMTASQRIAWERDVPPGCPCDYLWTGLVWTRSGSTPACDLHGGDPQ